jgi:hypothetical protein
MREVRAGVRSTNLAPVAWSAGIEAADLSSPQAGKRREPAQKEGT